VPVPAWEDRVAAGPEALAWVDPAWVDPEAAADNKQTPARTSR